MCFSMNRVLRPDEGDVLDGAACLGEARPGQLLCAGHVVRPAAATQPVQFVESDCVSRCSTPHTEITHQFSTGQTW